MKIKKRFSLLIALMMLMTVFAVPTLAYGAASDVHNGKLTSGDEGYYSIINQKGRDDSEQIEVGDSLQLRIKHSKNGVVSTDGWKWECTDDYGAPQNSVTIDATGKVTAIYPGNVHIKAKNDTLKLETVNKFNVTINDLMATSGDYTCSFIPATKKAIIYEYKGKISANMEVPETITLKSAQRKIPAGTYKVVELEEGAFKSIPSEGQADIVSIKIPDSIIKIKPYAVGYRGIKHVNEEEDHTYYEYQKVTPFTIYGYSPNPAAAQYARANGFTYINIGYKPPQSISGTSTINKQYGSKAFSLGATASDRGNLTYRSSNTKVATVSANGTVSVKGTGIAKITITAAETDNYGSSSKTVTVNVSPRKTAGIKAKTGKKKVTVSWKRDKRASGYQITYSQKKNFKKSKKVNITKNKTTKKVIKKLKSNKNYYIKVRSYKKVGSKKIYGPYSAVKKVKIK